MSEKDLARALLELDGTLPVLPDVRELTRRVIERDRRSVKRWTVVTVLLWLAALAMVLFIFVAMGLVMPMQAKVRDGKHKGRIEADEKQLAFTVNQVLPQMLTLGVAASVGLLGLAALGTLFLVRASRRATLRQVSASLLQISEQLEKLRQAVERPPAP
jgi:uncharacterized membrane protein YjgN (DUF898 family)